MADNIIDFCAVRKAQPPKMWYAGEVCPLSKNGHWQHGCDDTYYACGESCPWCGVHEDGTFDPGDAPPPTAA